MQGNARLPGFMSESPARVVAGESSTRDRGVDYDDAVLIGTSGVSPWEGGIPQESSAGTSNEADAVDVESISSTLPQLVLHRRL